MGRICGAFKFNHKLKKYGRFCDGFASHKKGFLSPVSTIFTSHHILTPAFDFTLVSWLILRLYSTMPSHLHTMPKSDKDVQTQVEQVFGFCPCLWQIHIVCAILA